MRPAPDRPAPCGHALRRDRTPRAPSDIADGFIDQHVSRPRVAGEDVLRPPAPGKDRHVADPTDVLHHPRLFLGTKEEPIADGHEGRALSPDCHVPHPEIARSRHTRPLRDDRDVADLQGRRDASRNRPFRRGSGGDRSSVRVNRSRRGRQGKDPPRGHTPARRGQTRQPRGRSPGTPRQGGQSGVRRDRTGDS